MFKSYRKFRLWDFRVSHNQALIRSPATPDISTNIDLVFWGVEFMTLPMSFDGLELEKGEDPKDVELESLSLNRCEVFLIRTAGQKFVVVAAGCKVLENSLDIFESSLEGFAETDTARDLGEVLAHS